MHTLLGISQRRVYASLSTVDVDRNEAFAGQRPQATSDGGGTAVTSENSNRGNQVTSSGKFLEKSFRVG